MTLPAQQVAWAQFAPDMSDYNSGASDNIWNVEPKADGWGPLPKFATFGTSIGSKVLGAFAFRRSNGSTDLYCGTATKLYRYNVSTASWTDFTRSSGGDYTTTEGNFWNFAQYGDRLIACNGTDATQYIDANSGAVNFAALPNAPIAKYVSSVGDFLVFGNLSTDPSAIAWSGINDSEYYTYGFRGSDLQPIPDGGMVQGIVPYGSGAIIFQRDKIRILERAPGNLIFTLRVLHENVGCFAPQSIVRVRNDFFWYDQGGYYRGVEAQPIGSERINRYVASAGVSSRMKYMRGANDPDKQMVYWVVDTSDDDAFMVGYDWGLDRWTQSDAPVNFIFPASTPGYTIDSVDTLFGTMDAVTIPWDSSFWTGSGVLQLAGFSATGAFGYFTGFNQEARFETNDLYLNPGGKAFVQSIRLVSDADHASAMVQIGTRSFHGEPVTWGATATPQGTSGRAWVRARGGLHRFRVTIAENASWTNASAFYAYAKTSGVR